LVFIPESWCLVDILSVHYREEDPEGFPHRLVQKTLKYKVEDGFGGRSASYFQLTAALSDSADVASQMEDVHLQSKYTLFSNRVFSTLFSRLFPVHRQAI